MAMHEFGLGVKHHLKCTENTKTLLTKAILVIIYSSNMKET